MEITDMIVEAYIATYGEERWLSLTDNEKHEVIMTIVKDLLKEYKED